MEIAIAVIVGAVALFAAVLALRRKVNRTGTRRVDNYALSIEEHDGFHFVHLKIQADDGSFSTYELEPPVAHVMSDELLATSAMARRDAHAPPR